MDFDSHFVECCTACNHQPSIESQGQGDCEGSIEIAEDQNIWTGVEKGKKLKTKTKEKDRSELKVDKQKKLESTHCDCIKKVNKKQDFSDKLRQEKKSDIMLENCNDPWNSPNIKWDVNNMERCYVSEEFRQNDLPNNKLLVETVLKLKEKVDFLFKAFNDCGEKHFTYHNDVQSQAKALGAVLKDARDLCNLNSRLCVAEDGIGKLALILEDLLKDSNRKAFYIDENVTYSDPLDFEELPIAQKINLLKSRNDMLLSFMKGFLKVGSVEEIYSRLAFLPEDFELKQMPLDSTLNHNNKNQLNDFSKEKVMEILRNLRMQFTKVPEKKSISSNEQKITKNAKKDENVPKSSGKMLEVISEQAELALYSDNESETSDNFRIKNTRNLKGKFSEVNEDLEETDLSLIDVTTRLFAQEAMLKSSLDKVHLELFSKPDSLEKNYTRANWDPIINPTKTEYPTREKDNKRDKEMNLDSTRYKGSKQIYSRKALIKKETNCIYCETEIAEKSEFNDATFYTKHDDYIEPVKGERNSLENNSTNLCKQNISSKNKTEHEEAKNKSCRRLSHKNSYILLTTSKPNQNNCCIPEDCSSSREETKTEVKARDQRPVTAPSYQNKTLLHSSLKPLALEKSNKKNLGIKNVKNKNKSLLSKKTFVQTS